MHLNIILYYVMLSHYKSILLSISPPKLSRIAEDFIPFCKMNDSNAVQEKRWDGHLFARTLPLGFDPNYDQCDKPVQRRISFLVPNFSPPSSFRLSRSRPCIALDSEVEFTGKTCELSLYLYDGASESKIVQLFRNADEPFSNTLKRIQISLSKKMGSKCKKSKSNNKNDVADLPSVWKQEEASAVELDISEVSCGALLQEHCKNQIFLQIPVVGCDEPLRVIIEANPPTITSVSSFDNLQANIFAKVPVHVQVSCLFATSAVVDWYADGVLVQNDSSLYVPTDKDIGKEVTVCIRPYRTDEHDGEGCQEAYSFTKRVEPFPENTLLAIRPEWTKPRLSTDSNLRVLTYNILADQNCTPSWHPYCDEAVLLKQRRFPLIVHEILSYHADIICLQEVDEHIFQKLLQPVLNAYGYAGYYSSKKTDGQMEGCGMFINSKRLEWNSCESHELKSALPIDGPGHDSWDSSDDIYKLLKQRPDLEEIILCKLGHILQLAQVREKTTGAEILVGNTHLFFHPNASHIRTLQMWSILRLLAQAKVNASSTDQRIILCGDFNSSLVNSCGKLLIEGVVPTNHRDLKDHLNAFQWGERGRRFETATSDDDFPEISVGDNFQQMNSAIIPAPAFTHLIPGFSANLDHIVISNGLVPLSHANMPTEDMLSFMPNENAPSDHVSLLCDLAIVS